MSEENKVRFGLSNVHVGTVTLSDGTPSFSIPKKYPGAVNLTMDAEGETNTFYADNIAYYVTNTNNGYTGELEMAEVPDWFETEYLGAVASQEGLVVEIISCSSLKEIKTQQNILFTIQLLADLRLKEIQKRIHLSQIRPQFRLHQFRW